MDRELYLPAGSAARDGMLLELTPERAGWRFAGLRVLELGPGQERRIETGSDEMLVLPLSGSASVCCEGEYLDLEGRDDVFSRVTDFAYLPIRAEATVRSSTGGKFALPSCRAERRLPVRYGAARDVPVELRGAGAASRQVNNFCAPEAFQCDRLVAVEVLTPAGNWSSYPPHKHDEARDGEAVLEEVYYFELVSAGIAYQRVYGTPERPIEVLTPVHSGDVVLVPHGYHGPSIAPPEHDLYYLNVLAGPAAGRTMACRDDPVHAWVRGTWDNQELDPRLPLTGGRT